MKVILGASGQVGSAVVNHLLNKSVPVRAIIRDGGKATGFTDKGAGVAVANVLDLPLLTQALKSGDTLFAITPESSDSNDLINETQQILHNYKEAVAASGITKVVGLSSMGAQFDKGTGNLLMSYLLEHAFDELNINTTFIRPAYYFSNWLTYADTIKEKGILPTFFPADLAIPMISPNDVAKYAADIMLLDDANGKIYELKGPILYSSKDVASAFAVALGIEVTAIQIPRTEWESNLQQAGFTTDAIRNIIEMTDAVIEGKATQSDTNAITLTGKTTLQQYILDAVRQTVSEV